MKSKSIHAFILLAFASVCLAQAPSKLVSQGDPATLPSVLRGTGSSLTLNALILKLNSSFQAVSQARDSRGYVRNDSLLKTHSAILRALKNTMKGKSEESILASPPQRRELKAELRALDDSFDQFLLAHDRLNNSEVVLYMNVKEAFSAHDTSLKRLNQLLKDEGLIS